MTCTYYQPLPISTGAVGLDRCGNIQAYAAPWTVTAPVGWCCWPIQYQGGWIYGPQPSGNLGPQPWWWELWWGVQGGVDPGFSAPPWWGPYSARASARQARANPANRRRQT